MALSKKIAIEFAKNIYSKNSNDKKTTFTVGHIVVDQYGKYAGVKLSDNSDITIPAKIPTNIKFDQMVNIMIKNHTISVIGNVTDSITERKYVFKKDGVKWKSEIGTYELYWSSTVNDGDSIATAKYRLNMFTDIGDAVLPPISNPEIPNPEINNFNNVTPLYSPGVNESGITLTTTIIVSVSVDPVTGITSGDTSFLLEGYPIVATEESIVGVGNNTSSPDGDITSISQSDIESLWTN